ncbi:MAG: hypothetical protein ACLQGP_21525 [Isosphaeraceae bacterium]
MSRNAQVQRLPYFMLGAMSLVSFGGPFAVFLVLRGGLHSEWPPDRPVEWIVIGLVIGLAVALFIACLSVGWWHSRNRPDHRPDAPDPARPTR